MTSQGILNLDDKWQPWSASHFKVLRQSVFYVMGKVLSGELSCMGTGLYLTTPHICEIF